MLIFQCAVLALLSVMSLLLVAILVRDRTAPAAIEARKGRTRTIAILSAPMALSEETMRAVRDKIEKSMECGARAYVIDRGMQFTFAEVYDDDVITTTTNPA